MAGDGGIRLMLGSCAAVLILATLHVARPVFAPVAFALFIIAIAWPLQRALQARLPKLLALALTAIATLVAVTALAVMVAWGFSRIGQWLVANAAHLQALYLQKTAWLEEYGIVLGSLLAEYFDVRWLVRLFQEITGRLQDFVSFAVVTLIFTLLGLLEVETMRRKLENLGDREAARTVLRAGAVLAGKLQRYMLVRTLMSAVTGIVIWGFANVAGLDLAVEWGVMAFALNYIPFIGPLVATLFPTVFAVLQFGSWQTALTVFLGLNLIQFMSGSYIEPRIAGAALSISPFVVLFAVFFWGFLWGFAGAFIGVPIAITLLTLCEHHPRGQWLAALLSAHDGMPR